MHRRSVPVRRKRPRPLWHFDLPGPPQRQPPLWRMQQRVRHRAELRARGLHLSSDGSPVRASLREPAQRRCSLRRMRPRVRCGAAMRLGRMHNAVPGGVGHLRDGSPGLCCAPGEFIGALRRLWATLHRGNDVPGRHVRVRRRLSWRSPRAAERGFVRARRRFAVSHGPQRQRRVHRGGPVRVAMPPRVRPL